MKNLPVYLALTHSLIATVIFFAVIINPEKAGLAPFFLVIIDAPISLFIEWVRRAMRAYADPSLYVYLDAFSYLVFGGLWYYFVGFMLRRK